MERLRRDPRGIIAVLAIALVASLLWGINQRGMQHQLRRFIQNERQRSFFTLVEHVQEINVLLGKTLVVGSPRQVFLLLADIHRQSEAAAEELNRLPLAETQLASTVKFLMQTGDYSTTLAEQAARGEPIRDDQWEQLRQLQQSVEQIQAEMQQLAVQASRGEIDWVATQRQVALRLKPSGTDQPMLSEQLANLEQQVQKFPTLRYDGPFADQMITKKLQIDDEVTVTEIEARQRVIRTLPDSREYTLTLLSQPEEPVPIYSFEATSRDDGSNYRIDVSKQGGHIIWWMSDQQPESATVSISSAAAAALDYLKRVGVSDVQQIGQVRMGNSLYVAFVKVRDDILFYPELFKVRVSLENGEILGYDAATYLSNRRDYRPEELTSPYTPNMMETALNPRLYVLSARKAVIPTRAGKETLTFEYRVQLEDQVYLVYLNAQTAEEEQVLRVLKSTDGEFTL